MLQFKWTSIDIHTNEQANNMIKLFKKLNPDVGGFDTETTGLHIIKDKPFLVQFGFLDIPNMRGYTFAVDLEKQPILAEQTISAWNKLATKLKVYLAQNIKFDLHMLTNIGLNYYSDNVSDVMFYIRHAHDALTPANGGPPLGLKEYATRYIESSAKSHEQLLNKEKTAIAKELNLKLKIRLAPFKPPAKYEAKSYTLSVLEQIMKDPIFDISQFEPGVKQAYLDWLQLDVPLQIQPYITSFMTTDLVPYNMLNRTNLKKYAHYDIIYLLEIYYKLRPIVENRKNMAGIEIENKLIYPFWEMERCGFAVDKDYLLTAKNNLKEYIKQSRKELFAIIGGEEFSIGQHEKVKFLLKKFFNIDLPTTNSETLNRTLSTLKTNNSHPAACNFIERLQELRTLEKWYSVYIMRFVKNLIKSDRLYTTLNQVGTVSGRITSDFQQFPSTGITTRDGVQLFSPRNLIKPTGGNYKNIIYLDYSQIELRFQAFYTILVGHPDLNLCRAYMPYKCVNKNNELFDYTNPTHIKNWNKEWYYEEDPSKHWIPTDVHGATTEKATGLTPEDEGFAYARKHIGKRVNFAKNYGAQFGKIKDMFPDKTDEEIKKIDGAYYAAFPGVKEYHNYCNQRAQLASYTENLFGVKYYGVSGHKLKNMLIQGSAAYFLKWKIVQLYEYMKQNNLKSRLQMQIHDELSWEIYDGETGEAFNFKRIMEDWDESLVPIVADLEITNTTWADKFEIKTEEDLINAI